MATGLIRPSEPMTVGWYRAPCFLEFLDRVRQIQIGQGPYLRWGRESTTPPWYFSVLVLFAATFQVTLRKETAVQLYKHITGYRWDSALVLP